MKKEEFMSGFREVMDKVAQSARKNLPIYAEKMKKAAGKYGRMGKDALQIQMKKGQIEKLYMSIGKAVYECRSKKENAAFIKSQKKKIDQCTRLYSEIAKIEKDMKALKSAASSKSSPRKKSSSKKANAKKSTAKKKRPAARKKS